MPCAAGLQQVTWHSLYLRRYPQSSPQSSRLQFSHSLLWPTLFKARISPWARNGLCKQSTYLLFTSSFQLTTMYNWEGIYTHTLHKFTRMCATYIQWRTLTQEYTTLFIKSDTTTWHITPLRWGGYYGKHFIPGSIVYLMKGLCINSFQQEPGRSVGMHHACSSICCS